MLQAALARPPPRTAASSCATSTRFPDYFDTAAERAAWRRRGWSSCSARCTGIRCRRCSSSGSTGAGLRLGLRPGGDGAAGQGPVAGAVHRRLAAGLQPRGLQPLLLRRLPAADGADRRAVRHALPAAAGAAAPTTRPMPRSPPRRALRRAAGLLARLAGDRRAARVRGLRGAGRCPRPRWSRSRADGARQLADRQPRSTSPPPWLAVPLARRWAWARSSATSPPASSSAPGA